MALQIQKPELREHACVHLSRPFYPLFTFRLKASDIHYASLWNLTWAALAHQFFNNFVSGLDLIRQLLPKHHLWSLTLRHGISSLAGIGSWMVCLSDAWNLHPSDFCFHTSFTLFKVSWCGPKKAEMSKIFLLAQVFVQVLCCYWTRDGRLQELTSTPEALLRLECQFLIQWLFLEFLLVPGITSSPHISHIPSIK